MSRTLKLALLVLLPVLAGVLIYLFFGPSTLPQAAHDDLAPFVKRFGPPDAEETNAHDDPRPQLVMRRIIYRPENVRITYVPADHGSPVENWKFLGMQDSETLEVLGVRAAIDRLAPRDRLVNASP